MTLRDVENIERLKCAKRHGWGLVASDHTEAAKLAALVKELDIKVRIVTRTPRRASPSNSTMETESV